MASESKLLQELGPKKYNKKVEEANKFYDKYKAGKRDPKTGEVYREIHYENPNKKAFVGRYLDTIGCFSCGEPLTIKSTTVIVTCGNCRCYHKIEHNREDDSFTVEAPNLQQKDTTEDVTK